MLFSLVLSMVLGSGVVMNEHIDSGLSYEECVHSSFQLQDIADDELASGELASGELASGELASGELASGELASGELASGELASGNYNIITAKTFCVWDREGQHE